MPKKSPLKVNGKLLQDLTYEELKDELDKRDWPYSKDDAKKMLYKDLKMNIKLEKLKRKYKRKYKAGVDYVVESLPQETLTHPQVQRYLKERKELAKNKKSTLIR